MFEIKSLNEEQLQLCQNTISSNTFFMLVGDALDSGKSLSVVRMGDGEHTIMSATNKVDPIFQDDRSERLGCKGIDLASLQNRLVRSANECTYFAPSVSGLLRSDYELYKFFNKRDRYVDNFFCNSWTEEMIISLFVKAGHVLFIHCSTESADAVQARAKWGLGVKVTYLKLCDWKQSDEIVKAASKINAPLTIFSAGPASKYIGPEIARTGNIAKVTLDIGNTSDHWLLPSLIDTHNKWDETNMHLKPTFELNKG